MRSSDKRAHAEKPSWQGRNGSILATKFVGIEPKLGKRPILLHCVLHALSCYKDLLTPRDIGVFERDQKMQQLGEQEEGHTNGLDMLVCPLRYLRPQVAPRTGHVRLPGGSRAQRLGCRWSISVSMSIDSTIYAVGAISEHYCLLRGRDHVSKKLVEGAGVHVGFSTKSRRS